jgi:hypothetical protein
MPRTKSLQHYPDRYQEIIRECGLEGKQIEVLLDDYKQALKLRGHWYAFIGSLKAEVNRIQKGDQPLTPGEEDLIQLASLSATVMVTISTGPLISLTFQSREHSWQAQALAGATVRTAEGKPTATGLDSAAMRLLAIQAEAQGRLAICPVCGDVLEPDQILTHQPCNAVANTNGGT